MKLRTKDTCMHACLPAALPDTSPLICQQRRQLAWGRYWAGGVTLPPSLPSSVSSGAAFSPLCSLSLMACLSGWESLGGASHFCLFVSPAPSPQRWVHAQTRVGRVTVCVCHCGMYWEKLNGIKWTEMRQVRYQTWQICCPFCTTSSHERKGHAGTLGLSPGASVLLVVHTQTHYLDPATR